MWRKQLVIVLLVGLLGGCNRESERERLKRRLEVVQLELESSRRDIETLVEIGFWLDSIDRNRYDVLVDWRDKGTPFDQYKYRLAAINNYVVETEVRIHELNEKIRDIRTSTPEADKVIARLRERIDQRNREIGKLKLRLNEYTRKNQALYRKASQQDLQFESNETQLEDQDRALKALTVKMVTANETYFSMQAESSYREAEALEEVANRTRFSSLKKRQALTLALGMYRRSLQFGNEQARAKILELEKMLD